MYVHTYGRDSNSTCVFKVYKMSFLIAYLKAFLDDNDGAKLNQRKRSSTPSPPKNLVMILYLALWYLSLAHTKTQQYIALSMVSMYIILM
jgi:hypothetical protein